MKASPSASFINDLQAVDFIPAAWGLLFYIFHEIAQILLHSCHQLLKDKH